MMLPAPPPFRFACPTCRAPLTAASPDTFICPQDGAVYPCVDGIWRLLPPARADHFRSFIREYETVRQREGWGNAASDYYRALPFTDLSGRHPAIWYIRARSFAALRDQVLPAQRPLRILDVGAGNGWLAYRLSQAGYTVAALDLLLNEIDGLGAYRHYDVPFTAVQAEFDHLPFLDAEADMIIFNGALHYSTGYEQTLREALRVLRPGGRLVIMDSPIYRDATSGAQMVQEREARFAQEFGFRGDRLPNENFLTFSRLAELGGAVGLRWTFIRPAYGWRWAIRPWLARLRGHREPATFLVVVGERA